MKKRESFKGPLKNYMSLPLLLTVPIILLNIPLYSIDRKGGICVSIFAAVYFVAMLGIYIMYRSRIRKEVVNFATQYATVQKKLLDKFEIPYALIEDNSKILWMNEAFAQITEKDKRYHKSITSIFPSITRELLEKEEKEQSIRIEWQDRIYRASVSRLYFNVENAEETEGTENVEEGLSAAEVKDQYLTSLYLFDETELNRHIQENREQQLVSVLVYIDNYEEALESIEEVKRSLLVALVDSKVSK